MRLFILSLSLLFIFFASTEEAVSKSDGFLGDGNCLVENVDFDFCFNSVIYDKESALYIYSFDLTYRKPMSKDGVMNDSLGIAKIYSAYLNPLSADFYDLDPILERLAREEGHDTENIIVEVKAHFDGNTYSTYVYPKEIDGIIRVYNNSIEGDIDLISYLKEKEVIKNKTK